MLAELSIKNFAIIESVSLSFEKGMTVLTGETGAGKSIIIDAIGLLAGGRGSTEFIRHGADKAEIEGLFLPDQPDHPSFAKMDELGIEHSDGMVILRRDISKSGKSVCRINGKLITLAVLREVSHTLIDIHGQHEHQELMDRDKHLPLLDGFNEKKTKPALQEYKRLYKQYKSLKEQAKRLNENEKEMAHRLDLIQYQLKEIQEAELQPEEDDALLEEKHKLSNYERIYRAVSDSYEALYGEKKGLDWVGLAMSNLEDAAEVDKDFKSASETVANSYYALEETIYLLRDKLEMLEFDPERLNQIETRLNEISFLKKKYGETVMDILEYAAAIEDEIDKIQNRDVHVQKLQDDLREVIEDLLLEAKNLTAIRKNLAGTLTKAIHRELKELYMEKTTFDIEFSLRKGKNDDPVFANQHVQFGTRGMDEVEFKITTNPGEPLKPLSKVASGGELSRIMLALKSIFSKNQGVTSIIFDEVDTGVSGRVAQAIAEKIHTVSVQSQVLCITHLPQVAAMADTHLYISKESKKGRTKTNVSPLEDEEKVKEIGRMISGVEITEVTKEHARELLGTAEEIKKQTS